MDCSWKGPSLEQYNTLLKSHNGVGFSKYVASRVEGCKPYIRATVVSFVQRDEGSDNAYESMDLNKVLVNKLKYN
eukprot:5108003-Amphidinium_carterae.1